MPGTPVQDAVAPGTSSAAALSRRLSFVDRQKLGLIKDHMALMRFCLDEGHDVISKNAVPRITATIWKAPNAKDRADIFSRLLSHGMWRELPKRTYYLQPCIPVIETNRPLREALPMGLDPEPFVGLTETLSVQAVQSFLSEDARASNDSVMLMFFDRMLKGERLPGRTSKVKEAAMKEWTERSEKMQQHIGSVTLLRHWSRRRAALRHATSSQSSQPDVAFLTPKYAHAVDTWGRCYGQDLCFQNLSRRVRGVVAGAEVQDWDISNCMFTLVSQLAACLEIKLDLPEVSLPMWNRYASDIESVRSLVETGFDCNAKAELLRVGHGGGVADSGIEEVDKFLAGVSREARLLRWLAASLLPEAHRFFMQNPKKYTWPQNTVFHYLWTTLENQCLKAMVGFVLSQPVVHLSLHFDGLLVDAARATSSPDFGGQLESCVREKTGFRVRLVQKLDCTFFESLRAADSCGHVVFPSQDCGILKQRGKGLPLALAHATGEYALFSAVAGSTLFVTYEQWSVSLATVRAVEKKYLQPYYGLQIATPGFYVLHAHCSGRPECMAVCVEVGGDARVYDGDVLRSVTVTEMQRAWSRSVDRSTVITFAFRPHCAAQPASVLLQLRAL